MTTKISVYGDSICISQQGSMTRAARIAAYSPKFNGYNDYARGGNSFRENIAGFGAGSPLFDGLNFTQQVATADDADLVIVSLGGNDEPNANGTGAFVHAPANMEGYLGSDSLTIGANILMHVQAVQATGKKVVLIGLPYYDAQRAYELGGVFYGCPMEQARAKIGGLIDVYANLRCVAGLTGVPWIAPFGSPNDPAQPVANYSSTQDGIHPTLAYSHAVSDYIAQRIIDLFSL